jgi:hypothetical protein
LQIAYKRTSKYLEARTRTSSIWRDILNGELTLEHLKGPNWTSPSTKK